MRSLDSCCKAGVEEASCEGGQTSEQRPRVERRRPPRRGAAWRETGEPGRRPGPRARSRGLRPLPSRVTHAARQCVCSTQTSSLKELRAGASLRKAPRQQATRMRPRAADPAAPPAFQRQKRTHTWVSSLIIKCWLLPVAKLPDMVVRCILLKDTLFLWLLAPRCFHLWSPFFQNPAFLSRESVIQFRSTRKRGLVSMPLVAPPSRPLTWRTPAAGVPLPRRWSARHASHRTCGVLPPRSLT